MARAFERVTQIKPNEPDAFYFVGYLNSQLQKYDEAIAAFQKGLALSPYHASAEFGLARALQRKGSTDTAREHFATVPWTSLAPSSTSGVARRPLSRACCNRPRFTTV